MDDGHLEAIHNLEFVELPVRAVHAWKVGSLPPIHGDPFDRILVAQAQAEELTLVTRDRFLEAYQIPIIAA